MLHYLVGQKYEVRAWGAERAYRRDSRPSDRACALQAHFDYFHDELNQQNGGQRVATLLMYLCVCACHAARARAPRLR